MTGAAARAVAAVAVTGVLGLGAPGAQAGSDSTYAGDPFWGCSPYDIWP